jgi:aspartyl-tRNA(Asn)/glutamyl-tRNA(Gln) amidotransferase subunit A
MTKSVRDAAIMLQAMCGHDPKDSTSADIPVPDFEAALTGDIRGKVIGIPRNTAWTGCPPRSRRCGRTASRCCAMRARKMRDISLPHTKYALPAYYVIAPAEASSNLARYDGVRYGHRAKLTAGDGITEMYEKTRAEGFGPEVQRRIMVGTYVLSAGFYDAYYNRARKVRALIKRDFETGLRCEGVDAILTPATPSAAFGLGEMADADPVQMYLNDVFTVTVNLAGLPGISVPVGLDAQGLPLGLQLIGRPWDEAELLKCAHVLEDRAGFVAKAEKWW